MYINDNLPELVKLLEDTYDHVENVDEYFEKILHLAIKVIPEADYASLIMLLPDQKKINWLAAVGHDIKKLSKFSFHVKNLDLEILEDINGKIIEGNILERFEKNFTINEVKKLKESLKPCKQSIVYTLELNRKYYLIFSLDISENSEKEFVDESKKTIKIFANIAYIFIKFKMKEEELKESMKNTIIEREKYKRLRKEFLSKAKEFKDILMKLISLYINKGRKTLQSYDILKHIVANVPFIERALIIEMKKDKFNILNEIGYEDLKIKEISIKDMYRKNNINVITFNELSGEFFELTSIDENTLILLEIKENLLMDLELEVLSDIISIFLNHE
jgi:hypothetical protein